MADVTVTGLTKDRMISMENATIIDGDVIGNNLILKSRDGKTIDAGNVRGPTGAGGPAGSGHIICTSSTRPVLIAADEGKTIYEKDTDLVKTWTGSRWKLEDHIICTSATRPAVVLADEGVKIRENDTDLEYTWSGSRWMIQPRIICTSGTRPTGLITGDEGVKIYETDTDLEYVWTGSTWVSYVKGLMRVLQENLSTADTSQIGTTEVNLPGYNLQTITVVSGRKYYARFGARCVPTAANLRVLLSVNGSPGFSGPRYAQAEYIFGNTIWAEFTVPLILPTGNVSLNLSGRCITAGTFQITGDATYPNYFQVLERIP